MGKAAFARAQRHALRLLSQEARRAHREAKLKVSYRLAKIDRHRARRKAEREMKNRHDAVVQTLLLDSRVADAIRVGDCIIFETRMMHVEIDGLWYRIGRFEVELNARFFSQKPVVRCLESGKKNPNERPNYYFEPENGASWFCVGTRMELLAQFVRDGEYLAAAYLLLEAFEYVNPMQEGNVVGANIQVPPPYKE